MERFAISADFEGAAAGWNQGERRDAIAELENLGRQTDSLRGVVSNAAILDPDLGFHRSLLSSSEISGKQERVKVVPLGLDGVSPPPGGVADGVLGSGRVGGTFASGGVEHALAQAE